MSTVLSYLPTILVGAVVFGIIALVLIRVIRDKKAHKGSCGCGCRGCASAGICHPEK